jgi:hypothetical protein
LNDFLNNGLPDESVTGDALKRGITWNNGNWIPHSDVAIIQNRDDQGITQTSEGANGGGWDQLDFMSMDPGSPNCSPNMISEQQEGFHMSMHQAPQPRALPDYPEVQSINSIDGHYQMATTSAPTPVQQNYTQAPQHPSTPLSMQYQQQQHTTKHDTRSSGPLKMQLCECKKWSIISSRGIKSCTSYTVMSSGIWMSSGVWRSNDD